MAITIMEVMEKEVGARDSYTFQDFIEARLPMIGGCQICEATIAAYNAYPSTTGYLKCKDCIGNTGFPTVEEFQRFNKELMEPRSEFSEDEFRYAVDNLWIWMCSEGWLIYDKDSGDTFMASIWFVENKENENEQV